MASGIQDFYTHLDVAGVCVGYGTTCGRPERGWLVPSRSDLLVGQMAEPSRLPDVQLLRAKRNRLR